MTSGRRQVVPRLPKGWEEEASQLKAFVRKREVRCPSELLRALLHYVLGVLSWRRVGMWAVLIQLADIGESAWRKRLRKASAWLLWLFSELLAVPVSQTSLAQRAVGRVLLIDATRLSQPAGNGDNWRLHTAYDLVAGRFSQVTLTDQHGGESLRWFELGEGDIVVADNGYGYRRSIATVVSQKADGVFHITPSSFPVEDAQGQAIDLLAWLHAEGESVRECTCWCRWQSSRYRVRVIALQLHDEAAQAARQRKREEARSAGRKLSQTTLFLAGWVLVVTTLPQAQWSACEVLQLYRARWQVELVYKRMKQLLDLNQIRSKEVESAQATVRALLVAWALQEEEASQLRAVLEQAQQELEACEPPSQVTESTQEGAEELVSPPRAISSWLLTALCLDTLRMQVQGQWSSERVRVCLPRLARFLRSSLRSRVHQETKMRRWLSRRLSGPEPVSFVSVGRLA